MESRKTSSIDKLSEEKLLNKLHSIIKEMSDFTLKTRNVHGELKEGTHELVRVFNCYASKWKEERKISISKGQPLGKRECAKCTGIQSGTEEPAKAKRTKDESTSIPCWWDMSSIKEPMIEHNTEKGTGSEVVGWKKRKDSSDKSQPQKNSTRTQ